MGCGVSKSIHEQIVSEKEEEIERLERELQKAQEENGAQKRQSAADLQMKEDEAEANREEAKALNAELNSARAQLNNTESELKDLQNQYKVEVAALTSAKDELQRAIKLSKQAISCLHDQADDTGKVNAELPEEVSAVIQEKDPNIPTDLKDTIRSVQDSVVEMKQMQKQIDLAQRKVNEYWQKIQTHEELILSQKRQILIVENQNEKLKCTDPLKRALKRRNSSTSHKSDDVPVT